MNEAYELELSELRAKMEKSEAFAATIPALSELILKRKISGE